LKKNGFWIYGLDMAGYSYKSLENNSKLALVVGSEGKGLSRLVKENCDHLVSIPMKGRISSLNASVATAVVVFELVNTF
jgi:23S rRNA (guanosine2251-2'-O)-methyltransferase